MSGYENGFRFDILGLAEEFAGGIPTVMEDGTPVQDGSTVANTTNTTRIRFMLYVTNGTTLNIENMKLELVKG